MMRMFQRYTAAMTITPLIVIASLTPADAQKKVQTERIEVPAETPESEEQPLPEILYDPERLPEPVRRMRAEIMDAARTGDIERLRPVVEMNELTPTFSFGDAGDPIDFWKETAGDKEGREILAIMLEILEAGYAHLDPDTPQEMYVWPYFYSVPFDRLTPAQEVELYKIITPYDRRQMAHFGAYNFYRLGIGPDGTWHFFVAGD